MGEAMRLIGQHQGEDHDQAGLMIETDPGPWAAARIAAGAPVRRLARRCGALAQSRMSRASLAFRRVHR
jgi:hypothetical protein